MPTLVDSFTFAADHSLLRFRLASTSFPPNPSPGYTREVVYQFETADTVWTLTVDRHRPDPEELP